MNDVTDGFRFVARISGCQLEKKKNQLFRFLHFETTKFRNLRHPTVSFLGTPVRMERRKGKASG